MSLKETVPDFKSLATIPPLTLAHQIILQPFTTKMESKGVSPLVGISTGGISFGYVRILRNKPRKWTEIKNDIFKEF